METNIPIYRAKKIDSDEYVIGWYSSPIIIEGKLYLSITNKDSEHRIDTTTLSIHFPDMIDSQGNKIFASLQEDGKGGDVLLFCEVEQITGTAVYEMASIFINGGCSEYLSEILQRKDENFKIIGIKE